MPIYSILNNCWKMNTICFNKNVFFILILSIILNWHPTKGIKYYMIGGHSSYNEQKNALASRLLNHEIDLNDEISSRTFRTLMNASKVQISADESAVINDTVIILISRSIDEMLPSDILEIYYTISEMNGAAITLIIIDKENEQANFDAILTSVAKCNKKRFAIQFETFNIVTFCNNSNETDISLSLNIANGRKTLNEEEQVRSSSSIFSFLSPIKFASANEMKKEHRNLREHDEEHKKHVHVHQHSHVKHKTTSLKYRKIEELRLKRKHERLIEKRKHLSVNINRLSIAKRKLLCKYRKSCYETGILPMFAKLPTIQDANYGEEEKFGEDLDIAQIKLLCKYRKSCYEEVGAESERKHHKRHRVLTAKSTSLLAIQKPRKRKTTKEIAEIAIKQVYEQEERASQRSLPTKIIIEKKLNKIEEKFKMRLKCKYRKSCYESGILPIITSENAFIKLLHFFTKHIYLSRSESLKVLSFEQLNDNEKKIYCKYRKSCYTNGLKPDIVHEQTFKYTHIIEKDERKIPVQVRCKYRLSCYETGILPDLSRKDIRIEEMGETKTKPISAPLSLTELKLHCKYRKSCYHQKAFEAALEELNLGDISKKEKNITFPQVKTAETVEPIKIENFKKENQTDEKSKQKVTTIKIKSKKTKKKTAIKEETIQFEEVKPIKKKKTAIKEETIQFEEVKPIKKKKIKKLDQVENVVKLQNVIKPSEENKINAKILTTTDVKKKKVKDGLQEKSVKAPKSSKEPSKLFKQSKQTLKPSNDTPKLDEPPKQSSELPDEDSVNKIEIQHEEKEETLIKRLDNFEDETITPDETIIVQTKTEKPSEIEFKGDIVDKYVNKLLCKYRKSCYKTGKLPEPQKITIHHLRSKEIHHRPIELRCKYRKSCYETGILPTNFHQATIHHLPFHTEIRKTPKLRCKYRKSCYETGEIPKIDQQVYILASIQALLKDFYEEGTKPKEKEATVEEEKLRCKYRKSCYTTGTLPIITAQTIKTIADTMKEPLLTKKQLCKYRLSCYAKFNIDTLMKKINATIIIRQEHAKVKKIFGKTKLEKKIKENITILASKMKRSGARKINRIKLKPISINQSKIDHKVHIHKKPPVSAASIKQIPSHRAELTIEEKLKCRYRLTCYAGASLNETPAAYHPKPNIMKELRRENGAPCNIYYISCRKMAGLAIKERAPIGPNGRRLCRKKNKVNDESIVLK